MRLKLRMFVRERRKNGERVERGNWKEEKEKRRDEIEKQGKRK